MTPDQPKPSGSPKPSGHVSSGDPSLDDVDVLVIGGGPHPGADATAVAREIATRLPDVRPGKVVLAAHVPDPAHLPDAAHAPHSGRGSSGPSRSSKASTSAAGATAAGAPDAPFPVPSHLLGPLLREWSARRLSWTAARAELDAVRDRLLDLDGSAALQAHGITLVRGHVAFLGRGKVAVGDAVLAPNRIVLATGSTPQLPDVPGLADTRYLTSETVLDLPSLPASMVILGAGPLGCELAQGFARFGVSVTLVDVSTRVLAAADEDACAAVEEGLRADGVRLLLGTTVAKVAPTLDGGAWVGTDTSGDVAAEALVVTTGRRARTNGLDLASVGIATSPGGAVLVDDRLRTQGADVLACGEVTGIPVYGASPGPMARVVAANVVARKPALRWAWPVAARITRTEPEVVEIGTVQQQALDDGASVGRSPGPVPGSWVSVLVGAPSGRGMLGLGGPSARGLLAATLVGPGASEAAGQLVLAVNAGLPAAALIDTTASDGTWAAAVQVAVAHALVARV